MYRTDGNRLNIVALTRMVKTSVRSGEKRTLRKEGSLDGFKSRKMGGQKTKSILHYWGTNSMNNDGINDPVAKNEAREEEANSAAYESGEHLADSMQGSLLSEESTQTDGEVRVVSSTKWRTMSSIE